MKSYAENLTDNLNAKASKYGWMFVTVLRKKHGFGRKKNKKYPVSIPDTGYFFLDFIFPSDHFSIFSGQSRWPQLVHDIISCMMHSIVLILIDNNLS